MKEIALTKGKVALVDDNDFERLNRHKWCVQTTRHTFYAIRQMRFELGGKQKTIYMHREILNFPKGKLTDHVDGNGLNNQRSNLRTVTLRQNLQNRHAVKSSRYPGVYRFKYRNFQKWRAKIDVDGKRIFLGFFDSEEEAFDAYASKVNEIGEVVIGCGPSAAGA